MMKNVKYLIFLLALVIVGLNEGCYYDKVIEVIPEVEGEVSFASDIIPIFNASCNTNSCHATNDQDPDLSPTNAYTALISGGYIDTDQPTQSELYQWMAGNRSIPMPLDGANTEYNALIIAWIQQGAQNN